MRKMKNSGIEWIGQIPNDWEVKKLKYLCKNITDGSHFSPETQLDGKTYITVTDVYDGVVHYESASKISERDFEVLEKNGCKPPIHSVLLAKDGTVGRTAIVEYNDYVVLSSLGILNPDENEVYYVFLKHLLDSQFLQEQMKLAMAGSALRRITIGKINKLITIVPPLPEQKKIADFLDEKCGKIDSIRSDVQREIKILNDYKKSVITEAVTKGLDPKAKMKNSGIEWIGKIPEHWSVKRNKYIMRKQKIVKAKYENEDILSLTMNGVVVRDLENLTGKRPASFDGYQIVYPNNLLMCLFDIDVTPRCVGLIKNYGLTSPAYSQFVMQDFAYAPYYYYYYLNIDMTKELLHLAKNLRHSLTEDDLGAISTVLPPISEQKAIANYLDEKCSEIDATIAEKQKQLETLEDYKKSLIFEYVTGKKEVPA